MSSSADGPRRRVGVDHPDARAQQGQEPPEVVGERLRHPAARHQHGPVTVGEQRHRARPNSTGSVARRVWPARAQPLSIRPSDRRRVGAGAGQQLDRSGRARRQLGPQLRLEVARTRVQPSLATSRTHGRRLTPAPSRARRRSAARPTGSRPSRAWATRSSAGVRSARRARRTSATVRIAARSELPEQCVHDTLVVGTVEPGASRRGARRRRWRPVRSPNAARSATSASNAATAASSDAGSATIPRAARIVVGQRRRVHVDRLGQRGIIRQSGQARGQQRGHDEVRVGRRGRSLDLEVRGAALDCRPRP